MRKMSLLLVIMVFSTSVNSLAFNHEKTHRRLTEKAIESSKFKDAAYLENNLNLSNGVETFLRGITIKDWITEGSYLEDEPNCRASNHFHNPLKLWTDSYMSDQPWFINWWCSEGEYTPENINSAVHWATGYTEPAPGGIKVETGNQWDWDYAREYYYICLTGKDLEGNVVAGTIDERETNFAKCFQGLGQVLHLVQDMAVPAHVRNDFKSHLDFQGITPATFFKPKKWFGDKLEYYVEHHIKELLMGSVGGELTEPSLTKFWDTNDYIVPERKVMVSRASRLIDVRSLNYYGSK